MAFSMSISLPTPQFSFSKSLTSQNPFCLFVKTPTPITIPRKTTIIRMGGGPRTYPGGVSKWQWKRMQAKKSKQLLKARLARERQIYEMRKRAELKAAVSELERPWEVVEKAPNLFSVKADEQVKVLADRFQKPGGFDMWSDNDGPQLFQWGNEGLLPSARFFPKGVVHSVKPYGLIGNDDGDVGFDDGSDIENKDGIFDEMGDDSDLDFDGESRGNDGEIKKKKKNWRKSRLGLHSLDRQRGNNGALMKRGERGVSIGNRNRNDGRVDGSGGVRNSGYNGTGDGLLMKKGDTRSNGSRGNGRISRNDGFRNYRNMDSGDDALMQRGETRSSRGGNDGRVSRNGGLRNYRNSAFGDGALRQGGETRNNRSRNEDRMSRNGGLRNSYQSRDGRPMQNGERKTLTTRNDGRVTRNGGMKNTRYSGYKDGASMRGGESRFNGSRNGGRTSKSDGLRSSRYSSDSEVFDMSLQEDGSYGF